jgi:hypothetical protein
MQRLLAFKKHMKSLTLTTSNEMVHISLRYPYTLWLLSRVASLKSSKKKSRTSQESDNQCDGHNCLTGCGTDGHCHTKTGGHHYFSQGPIPSQDYAELRHPHNRWRV